MKVYLSGSLAGSKDLNAARERYERLARACSEVGYHAYLPHQNTDPIWAASLESSLVYAKDLAELTSANIVLAYLGEPSLGVGAEVAIAMQQNKSIIAVWENGQRMSRFMAGLLESYPKSIIGTVDNEDEACRFVQASLTKLRDY